MAVDPWAIDASGGAPSYSAQDARLGTVLPFLAGAGASLGVRSGVRLSGSGTDLLVQAQGTPNMTVKVNPGAAVVQGAISTLQGAYSWVLDTVTNLTISASHATLDRTDLICVRIRDSTVDTSGQRDASVVVVTGTAGGGVPALPTDATYMTIAQVSVVHAVTSITSGAITDKRPFLAALGAEIQCVSTARPTASSCAPYQRMVEIDTGLTYRNSGTKWLRERVTLLQTGEQSNNTGSSVNSNYLYFSMEANSTYQYELSVLYTALATPKINLSQNFPANCRIDFGRHMRGADGLFYNDAVPNITATGHLTTSQPASTSYGAILILGQIATGATAGTYQVGFAQYSVDAANPTYLLRGSYLTYKQIA